jgi:hypothetical protein
LDYDILKKNLFDVKKFIPEYKILQSKYENISSEKLIDVITKLENEIKE